MCIAAAAIPAISLALSAVSTGVGMVQQQQQAQMQARQAQQQAILQQRQQEQQFQQQQDQDRRQREQRNKEIKTNYDGRVRAQQAGRLAYEKQNASINSAVNKTYVQEQEKLNEARDQAAFQSQSNLIKSIGTQGAVLASGASGQSVGLMALDAERQQGLATAQANAGLRSAASQAGISQDIAFDQARSQMNQNFNTLEAPVAPPTYVDGTGFDIGIPESLYK